MQLCTSAAYAEVRGQRRQRSHSNPSQTPLPVHASVFTPCPPAGATKRMITLGPHFGDGFHTKHTWQAAMACVLISVQRAATRRSHISAATVRQSWPAALTEPRTQPLLMLCREAYALHVALQAAILAAHPLHACRESRYASRQAWEHVQQAGRRVRGREEGRVGKQTDGRAGSSNCQPHAPPVSAA